MEDNLEVSFGFTAEEVSLVSRAGLLTPQAPSGASTDGDQVRAGLMVNPDSTLIAMESSHSMQAHSVHNHSMSANGMSADGKGSLPSSSGDLQASVAGQLYSGGMGGTLTLSNTSAVAQSDWSFSFLTNQSGFESWSAESSVTDLGGGTYQVMITPPAWGLEIPAGGYVVLAFNANSVGLPATGDLTNALFFVKGSGAGVVAPVPPENSDTSSLAVIEAPPVVETLSDVEASLVMADAQGLSVSATINGGWSGVFAGEISVTNLVDVSAGTDWNVALVIDVPLTSVSNFDVESSLRSDGHYEVSLSPKAWSAPLALGASQVSYYQAAGDATDPAQVFDFVDVVVSDRSVTTLEQTDPPAQITESALSDTAEIESIAIVEPIVSNQSNDSVDPQAEASMMLREQALFPLPLIGLRMGRVTCESSPISRNGVCMSAISICLL